MVCIDRFELIRDESVNEMGERARGVCSACSMTSRLVASFAKLVGSVFALVVNVA